MSQYTSTKVIELGSCAFRQWKANHSHCRFLHGYQLKAKFWFGCRELDNKNWAVDFGGLKELKHILQQQFDHTTVVAQDDPELETFKELDKKGVIQLRVMAAGVGIERTAEWVFITADTYIKELTEGRCWVDRVEVFEHEDNSAIYTELCRSSISQIPQTATVSLHQKEVSMPTLNESTSLKVSSPAPVGSQVTEGKGGWFSGTSWGN